MNKSNTEFYTSILMAKKHQNELRTMYKSIIRLLNDLRDQSKYQMTQISDIEDGLVESAIKIEFHKKNIAALTQDIKEFNLKMKPIVLGFNTEYDQIFNAYKAAIAVYRHEDNERNNLEKAQQELVFLDQLLRRFREKIASLQQMNNVLFSFSEEFKKVKENYKENLSYVNASVSTAIDNNHKVIEEIQSILQEA